MKAVLALALLCGTILSVESACDPLACSSPSDSSTCDSRKTYLECLKTEAAGCPSNSQSTIFSTIDSAEAYIKAHCDGCMVTMSISTLILCLLAAYLKA